MNSPKGRANYRGGFKAGQVFNVVFQEDDDF